MSSGIIHVHPDFYGDATDKHKPAPVLEVCAIDMRSFTGKPFGSFADKSLGDGISSVSSANSSSDKEESFDNFDVELEALFQETTPRCVSMSTEAFVPKVPDLIGSSDDDDMVFRLKKKKQGGTWIDTRMRGGSFCSPRSSSNTPRPRFLSLGNSYESHPISVNCGRDIGGFEQEGDDTVDEFAAFIDRMIQST